MRRAERYFPEDPKGVYMASSPSDQGVWCSLFSELDNWLAAAHIVTQNGELVVAELRLFPKTIGLPDPPAWDGEAPVPPGGLGSTELRKLHLGAFVPTLRWHLWAEADGQAAYVSTIDDAFKEAILAQPKRPGRAGHPDKFYATIAKAYVDALQRGSKSPIQDLATALDYSTHHIRDLVKNARQKGLLSAAPGRGRAGGHLTDQGRELINQSIESETES